MRRICDYLRLGVSICLIGACALSAAGVWKQAYYYLFHWTTAFEILLGLCPLTTWNCLAVGSMGLLYRQNWSYWLIYVAALLNIVTGIFFMPFIASLVVAVFDPEVALLVLLYGVNGMIVGILIIVQLATRLGVPADRTQGDGDNRAIGDRT